jgi:FkbM family methyltransferase
VTLRKRLANLARSALRATGIRSVARDIRGAPVQIPLVMGELKSLLFDRSYSPFFNEDDVMDALVPRMRPDDIVFDIGAYHGVWAVLLSRHARHVAAFEPNPGTFAVLQETLAVNRIRNVSIWKLAMGAKASLENFWGTGSGASLRPGAPDSAQTRVQVETLDGFAEKHPPLPDVLKIDVEGAEHQVLTGARRCLAHARLVCIELHFDALPTFGGSQAAIDELMGDAGFVEIARNRPMRLGAEDLSRLHVIYEKALEGR